MDRVLACGAIDGSSNLPGGTIIALKLKIPFDRPRGFLVYFFFFLVGFLGAGFFLAEQQLQQGIDKNYKQEKLNL